MYKSFIQIKFLIYDLRRYWGTNQFFGCSFFTVFIWIQSWNNVSYRIRRFLFLFPKPFKFIFLPLIFVIDRFFSLILGTNIPASADIGPRFFIAHIGPVTVGKHTKAGSDFFIRQGVTIGGDGTKDGHPCFGDNVTLGANACVVGPIIVGNGALVGANTFLNKDLCSGGKAIGARCVIISPSGSGV